MRSWNELLQNILSRPSREIKNLDSVLFLDQLLDHPHRAFRSIHIGGTNGKGSVATKVAKGLEAEGFKVGLYTSPHIQDARERIQINGEMILEKTAASILERLLLLEKTGSLSFFDLFTLLAFVYFKEQKVDFAVIEVGLGGKWDTTNIITAEIAVITSIGFDHMRQLGNTLEEIAREKGGIAKPKIPLVTGPTAAPFFKDAIKTLPAPFFDLENQEIARAVLKILQVSNESIEKGLAKRPPCRFELRNNCIYDVAHNPDGFRKLLEALRLHFPNKKYHFIVAFSKDKDWRACLDLIRKVSDRITALLKQYKRLEDPEVLRAYAPEVIIAPSIPAALQRDALNIICGSFYIQSTCA